MRNQALCAAATSNDATLTKTLLDAKADVAWKNADGKTAFDLASAPEIKVLIARAEKAPPVLKGAWTQEEDETVIRLVGLYGPARWAAIASNLPGRNGKQCRDRWHQQLDPNIKRGPWTEEEDRVLTDAVRELGSKWTEISKVPLLHSLVRNPLSRCPLSRASAISMPPCFRPLPLTRGVWSYSGCRVAPTTSSRTGGGRRRTCASRRRRPHPRPPTVESRLHRPATLPARKRPGHRPPTSPALLHSRCPRPGTPPRWWTTPRTCRPPRRK